MANDKDIIFPSAQTPQHNTSLVQGCSFGRRDNPGAGHSFAGGLGILADGGGHNVYSCGVFGQAVAYWFGLGLLYEGAGHNTYFGQWYVQGSAVHHSAAALVNIGGHNHYQSEIAQNDGHAKDFSCALLHDIGGNNIYECHGSMSLGSAWYNAAGVLWNDGANDTFLSGGGISVGSGQDGEEGPCISLFLHGPGACQIKGPHPFPDHDRYWNIHNKDGSRSIGWLQ